MQYVCPCRITFHNHCAYLLPGMLIFNLLFSICSRKRINVEENELNGDKLQTSVYLNVKQLGEMTKIRPYK